MATKYNSEGRVPANYPGLFNARENRMITHNYSVVKVEGETDNTDPENPVDLAISYEIKSDDGVTHLFLDGTNGTVTITLPAAALSKGRLLKVYVFNSAEAVSVGGSSYSAGSYEIFCDGSSYFRVF
jgi:hypothetical protein